MSSIAGKVLDNEKSYPVIGSALMALSQTNPTQALERAEKLEKEKLNPSLISAIGVIYGQQGNVEKLSFFEDNWAKIDGPSSGDFFFSYANLLLTNGGDIKPSLLKLKNVGVDMGQSPWRRISATQTISELSLIHI